MTRKKEYTRRVREQAGQPPGTPLFIGKRRMEQVRISYMRYNESLHEEKEMSSPRECAELCRSNDVVWINVEGIHDESVVEELPPDVVIG